jgi:hypothetical protein
MTLLPSYFQVQLAMAPLPPLVSNALSEIEVETSIDGASMFRLHLDLARDALGDFDALAIDLFRPLCPIRVSLSFGLGLPMTVINGYVRDVQFSIGNEPGTARLEVTGADALGTIMGHVQAQRPWGNLPDSAVVASIFGKYAMGSVVFQTPVTRSTNDTTTTQQTRDNAFLRKLADFHGYHLYVQPDVLTGMDLGHFKPLQVMLATPPQGVLSIDFGSQTNMSSFQLTNQMLKPTTLTSVFPEPDTRAPIPVVAPVSSDLPMGLEPSLFRFAPLPPPVEVETGNEAANVAEKYLQSLAKVTESARTIQASGEVDGLKFARPLLPGVPVMIRGAGREHSGQYLVAAVTHRISRDGYTQSFQAMRNAVTLTGAELFVDPLAPVT